MSEPNSLYVKLNIGKDKLNNFFASKPVQANAEGDWLSWWNSREMYSKAALTTIPVYTAENNKNILDQFLASREMGGAEHYDAATESWTFVIVFCSENFFELLPILAFLKSIAPYQETNGKGVAFIYDFYWGDETVMAYLDFNNQTASFRNYSLTSEVNPAILEEANNTLENIINKLNEAYED